MDGIVLKALIPILTAIITAGGQILIEIINKTPIKWLRIMIVTAAVAITAVASIFVIISNATQCAITNLGWVPFNDDKLGSTIIVNPTPGSNCDFEVAFDLKEQGAYVATYKKLDQKILAWWVDGIKFSYKGMGAPNSIEFKLFGTEPSQDYRVRLGHAADTDGETLSVSIPYGTLTNPASGKRFERAGLVLDRMDFSFSSWPGDTPGTGNLIISNISVILSWKIWLIIISPLLLIVIITAYGLWRKSSR